MTHVRAWISIWMLAALLAPLTSCYRMPTEDDYSVVPTTNNPDVTREKRTGLPGVQY